MARLMAVANGNNTDAATWAVIDSTSFLESESASNTLGTSYTGSSNFTPGAITVDGIGVRISVRLGTTGTMSVELYNATAAASVAGAEVTVNCSDVVDCSTANVDGGWMFFKFSAPVLLLAATNYQVRAKTSDTNQIALYNSGSSNWSRILRTTTTQAPVAGDDRFVMGEWTGAGAMTSRTVTLNDTVSVDYGSASTSLATPALSISNGGIVLAGTTAATTYVQKISGNVVVYHDGILRLGTSGSRMPSDSSFTWTIDCTSAVEFGIEVRANGEFSAYGETKTRWTLLTGDEAAGQTVIGVQDTTGWKVGDTLLFAATGTTTTHGETATILTVDSATQVTLSAGLTNAHTGSGAVVGEVGNLTSNVKIVGASSSLTTFITYKVSSLGILDNVEVQYYGSGNGSKRGVEIQHLISSSNSVTLESCAFRDPLSNTSVFVGNQLASGSFFYITNCVLAGSISAGGMYSGGSNSASDYEVSDNLISGQATAMATGFTTIGIGLATGILSGNRIAGCTTGVSLNTSAGINLDTVVEISGFKVHSCSTGLTSSQPRSKLISNCDFNRNVVGITLTGGVTEINNCNFIGNSLAGYNPSTTSGATPNALIFSSCVFEGEASFTQTRGVLLGTAYTAAPRLVFNSCTFGVGTAHSVMDVDISNIQGGTIIFNSCTFASTTEITSTVSTALDDYASVQIQRKDNTDGNHIMYVKQGIITPDTTIFRTASPSIRIAPKSATITCSNYLTSFKAYVNNGQTCTPTLYVRESVIGDGADYNGNLVKLYVKANYNLGITSDTLLDTATVASAGAWEALTGTTSAVTDDGVLEFYVVLDGTAGYINVDDFTFVNA